MEKLSSLLWFHLCAPDCGWTTSPPQGSGSIGERVGGGGRDRGRGRERESGD